MKRGGDSNRVAIVWVSRNIERQPDARGDWRSGEGRFEIAPQYRHTVYPDAYRVRDRVRGDATSFDTVRDCKAWAARQVLRDIEGGLI